MLIILDECFWFTDAFQQLLDPGATSATTSNQTRNARMVLAYIASRRYAYGFSSSMPTHDCFLLRAAATNWEAEARKADCSFFAVLYIRYACTVKPMIFSLFRGLETTSSAPASKHCSIICESTGDGLSSTFGIPGILSQHANCAPT